MKEAKFCSIFVAMSAVAVLAGCGGGSSTAPPPPDVSVNLLKGHGIPEGRYTIDAGESRELGNVAVSCPAGGPACVVTVASLDATAATYERAGGTPAFRGLTTGLSLPSGHGVAAGMYTLRPGGSRELGNVVFSCPAGGETCVVTVESAATATYAETGGTLSVRAVLVEFDIEPYHGITVGENISIPAGSQHHGRHGVSLACPAGGMNCVVDVTGDEWRYHRTGGVPEVVIHELARAANDQAGRAASVFTRTETSGTGNFVSRLDASRYVGGEWIDATAVHDGTEVSFDLMLDSGAPALLQTMFGDLDDSEIDSNIPELDGWTGAALSRSDSTAGMTIHANVYSDITDETDMDYLVLGAWLVVPDETTESTSLAGVLVDGSDPFEVSSIADLTGSATYSGPAIGIYEQRTAGTSEDVRIGSFVASAELAVDFDSVVAATVSGSITDFEDNGQSLGGWEVRLPGTDITGGDNTFGGSVHLTPDGGGTVHENAGDWNGRLFGDTTGDPTAYPTSIAGSFEAEVGQRLTPVPNDIGYLGLVGAFAACHESGSTPGC